MVYSMHALEEQQVLGMRCTSRGMPNHCLYTGPHLSGHPESHAGERSPMACTDIAYQLGNNWCCLLLPCSPSLSKPLSYTPTNCFAAAAAAYNSRPAAASTPASHCRPVTAINICCTSHVGMVHIK
jgi:hypothetical protein